MRSGQAREHGVEMGRERGEGGQDEGRGGVIRPRSGSAYPRRRPLFIHITTHVKHTHPTTCSTSWTTRTWLSARARKEQTASSAETLYLWLSPHRHMPSAQAAFFLRPPSPPNFPSARPSQPLLNSRRARPPRRPLYSCWLLACSRQRRASRSTTPTGRAGGGRACWARRGV